jgi:hypothetical protein
MCISRFRESDSASPQINADDQEIETARFMPRIDLSFFQEVIIFRPTSVVYTNQAAGIGCLHPEEEGVFCPLPVEPGKAEIHALSHHFKGPWGLLTQEDADVVDGILHRNGHESMKVDRTRLSDSYEAWVYVLIADVAETKSSEPFAGFDACKGVLTWPNSD